MEKFEISCIQRGNKGFRFSLFSILSSSHLICFCFPLAVLLHQLTLTAQLIKVCQHNFSQNVSMHLSHSPIFSSSDLFLARSNKLVYLNGIKPLASGLETRTCTSKLLNRPPWEPYRENVRTRENTRGFHKPREGTVFRLY